VVPNADDSGEEWLPKCVLAVCEACKADESSGCVDGIVKDYDIEKITQTDPKVNCGSEMLDYATSMCYTEMLANCKVTQEWVDACVQDVCAASNAGDSDPLSIADGYCDNQDMFEEEKIKIFGVTTTTTTWIPPVDDTPDWNNGDGHTCADYKQNGWCKDGGFVQGFEQKGDIGGSCDGEDCGLKFMYPSLNCAVCGKDKSVECFDFDVNYKNFDLPPGNDDDALVDSPLTCQLLCRADSACKFWNWQGSTDKNGRQGKCHFKSSNAGKMSSRKRTRMIGGPEWCEPLSDNPEDCTPLMAPDHESRCRQPTSSEQCGTFAKALLGSSATLTSAALGDQFPKGCFAGADGSYIIPGDADFGTEPHAGITQVWWNSDTGDGNSAPDPDRKPFEAGSCCDTSARRICCGNHVLPVTPAPPPATPPPPVPEDPSTPPLRPDVDKTVIIERPANPVYGLCQVYGDPHLVVFDSSGSKSTKLDFLTWGNHWIVKSPAVWMQGNYRSIDLRKPGVGYLSKLAVGGPFLQGNALMVEGTTAGLQIWWNDALILPDVGTHQEMSGAVVVVRVLKGGKKALQKLKIQLPGDVSFDVVAFSNPKKGKLTFLNAGITMRQITGQDGQCGNFNVDPSDDTEELINKRGFGDKVGSPQLLIPPIAQA